jgi:hypothetical protein
MTFNINEYLSELTVNEDDIELKQALELVELTELICDDAWLARQDHYGSAGAMERQIEYLGGTLLPNSERKTSRMAADGIIGESYVMDNWFGKSNDESRHESELRPTVRRSTELCRWTQDTYAYCCYTICNTSTST